jgi:hypothetical protein
VASTRVAARNALLSAAHGLRLQFAAADVAAQLRFGLWAWDCEAGLPAQDEPRPGDGRLKTLRLSLGGVRGAGGAQLGAVLYADTFLAVPAGEGADAAAPSLINFTQAVCPDTPTYVRARFWGELGAAHAARPPA